MSTIKSITRLALIVAAFAATACADSIAGPTRTPTHARATRDTTVQGDSTLCRTGFVLIDGRVVCNGEG